MPMTNLLKQAYSTLRNHVKHYQNPNKIPTFIFHARSFCADTTLQNLEDPKNKEFKKALRDYKEKGENLETLMEMMMQKMMKLGDEYSSDLVTECLERKPKDVSPDEYLAEYEESYFQDQELSRAPLSEVEGILLRKYLHNNNATIAEEYDQIVNEMKKQGLIMDAETFDNFADYLELKDELPENLKQKLTAKANELHDKRVNFEFSDEEERRLYKEYEEQVIQEYLESLPPEKESRPAKAKKNSNAKSSAKRKTGFYKDPPGEGPILRWHTRVVLPSGGNSWHPSNRIVKVHVSVNELGLSEYAKMRLLELVGKRYHRGDDELKIVSDSYSLREENRKNCLRILYDLIEEAKKADDYVREAKIAYLKEELRQIPGLLEKLQARIASRASDGMIDA